MGWFARKRNAQTGTVTRPERERDDKPEQMMKAGDTYEMGNTPMDVAEQADGVQAGKTLEGGAGKKSSGKQCPPRPIHDPLLMVKDVERSFDVGGTPLHVLKGINMSLHPNSLVMLRGRSGSGKTTLLNMIGGLDQPSKGSILFQGHPFHEWNDEQRTEIRRKEIGFIFQSYALLPLLSAYENVELALRMADIPRSEWKPRVQHCLGMVGLSKRMYHRPFELSGGEQQRVAIAKAIAHRPSLLLADEPTAELDSQMGAQVMAVFREIIEQEQVTICMTTHDPTIMEVADHVYEMVDGRFLA